MHRALNCTKKEARRHRAAYQITDSARRHLADSDVTLEPSRRRPRLRENCRSWHGWSTNKVRERRGWDGQSWKKVWSDDTTTKYASRQLNREFQLVVGSERIQCTKKRGPTHRSRYPTRRSVRDTSVYYNRQGLGWGKIGQKTVKIRRDKIRRDKIRQGKTKRDRSR